MSPPPGPIPPTSPSTVGWQPLGRGLEKRLTDGSIVLDGRPVRPCRAEVDWARLQPWLIGGGVAALVMLFVLAKIGARPCTDRGSHSS